MEKMWGRFFGHRIICDECGRAFRPNLADQPRPDGGLTRRFLCPHCGKETIVAHISPLGRSLMQELQDVALASPDAKRSIAKLRELIKREVTRP